MVVRPSSWSLNLALQFLLVLAGLFTKLIASTTLCGYLSFSLQLLFMSWKGPRPEPAGFSYPIQCISSHTTDRYRRGRSANLFSRIDRPVEGFWTQFGTKCRLSFSFLQWNRHVDHYGPLICVALMPLPRSFGLSCYVLNTAETAMCLRFLSAVVPSISPCVLVVQRPTTGVTSVVRAK